MTYPPTREQAAAALGVAPSADPEACKRAYRRLAREHHPDVGGDPARFQALQRAYERLVSDADGPAIPAVSRGNPSRPPVSFVDETTIADLGSIDWNAEIPDGRLRLDRHHVAGWLIVGSGPDQRAVQPLQATSRAPDSRLNRAAHLLAPELTSRLTVTDATDDRGSGIVAIEVVGGNRRARRALDRVPLQGAWVRTRRSSTTLLRTTLAPSLDPRATAVRATDRLEFLLDALRWPLPSWTLERP